MTAFQAWGPRGAGCARTLPATGSSAPPFARRADSEAPPVPGPAPGAVRTQGLFSGRGPLGCSCAPEGEGTKGTNGPLPGAQHTRAGEALCPQGPRRRGGRALGRGRPPVVWADGRGKARAFGQSGGVRLGLDGQPWRRLGTALRPSSADGRDGGPGQRRCGAGPGPCREPEVVARAWAQVGRTRGPSWTSLRRRRRRR